MATPIATARLATIAIDLTIAGGKFYGGDSSGGALGVGSFVAGTGVELMARPLGVGIAGALGHVTGMGYDRLAKPPVEQVKKN